MADAKPFNARQQRVGDIVMKIMTRVNNVVYRASGGRLGGKLMGAPVCLLTTTGRKSGQQRTVPLLFLRDGDDIVVVASKGGMPTHPAWFLNLRDDPSCAIQVGTETRSYVARIADDTEKAALWPRLVAMYRHYDDYQARTERNIPVVVCSPA